MSNGHRKNVLVIKSVDLEPFSHQNKEKPRLSKVDALESNPSGRRTIIRNDITTSSTAAQPGSTAALEQSVSVPRRRTKKSRIKSSTVAVYASIFVLLVVLIAVGYRAPQEANGLANAAVVPGVQPSSDENTAVNNVVATNIAANVATATNLSVAPSVASLAISTQIESELPTANESSISKPTITQVSSASRTIQTYTVEAGDTVDTLAVKFKLSKDTIKWANNLTSDALTVGQTLQILPRDGIVYTVKAGDTTETVAAKYKVDPSVITTYNDLEISGLTPGLKIIIPNGVLPTEERPGYIAPTVTRSAGGAYYGYRAGSVGNRYAFGNCTWYAYERRAAFGKPVGSFWGNGGSWGYSAAASGYRVDNIPEAGAVLVERGSPGHVAVVESVGEDGTVIVSEMNNSAYGGFNIVNNRTISAGQAGLYQYIH